MKYRKSKYNYVCSDGKSGLLIFNSARGLKGLLKAEGIAKAKVEALLDNTTIDGNFSEYSIEAQLVNAGIFVEDIIDEDKLLKEMYKKTVVPEMLSLTIIPTERCNFRCVYCYENFENNDMADETINNIAEYVEKNIDGYKGLYVSWFGGEPLERMDVILKLSRCFIEICKRHQKRYLAGITTNGYSLDWSTFQQLRKLFVVDYQVTLDGLKSRHNRARRTSEGGDTFERIITNLKAISRGTKSSSFQITVRTNLTNSAMYEFDEFIDFYIKEFGDDKRFSLLLRFVMDMGGNAIHEIEEEIMKDEQIEQMYERLLKRERLPDFTTDIFLNPGEAVCYAAKENTYVLDTEGNMHKCTVCFEDKKAFTLSCVGKIGNKGEFIKNIPNHEKWICKSLCPNVTRCFFAPICLGESCPKHRVIDRAQFDTCPFERRFLSQLLRVADKQGISTIIKG